MIEENENEAENDNEYIIEDEVNEVNENNEVNKNNLASNDKNSLKNCGYFIKKIEDNIYIVLIRSNNKGTSQIKRNLIQEIIRNYLTPILLKRMRIKNSKGVIISDGDPKFILGYVSHEEIKFLNDRNISHHKLAANTTSVFQPLDISQTFRMRKLYTKNFYHDYKNNKLLLSNEFNFYFII